MNAHMLTEATLYSRGGLHDILFLLKSFDLEIRMGYPLRTVFAYGRADVRAGLNGPIRAGLKGPFTAELKGPISAGLKGPALNRRGK